MANPLVRAADTPRILSLLLAYYKAEQYLHLALASVADSEQKYARAFKEASENIRRNGKSLGDALKEQQIFDDNIIEILQAGQNAGELEQVLVDVIRTTKQQNLMVKDVYKAVSYQLILLVATIVVSPYLIHSIADSTSKGSTTRQMADYLNSIMSAVPMIEVWYPVAVIASAGYLALSKSVRMSLITFFGSLPYVSNAVGNYQTGQWCNYAALMFKAGLPLPDVERMLKPMLIKPLQFAFEKTFRVAIEKGWGEAFKLVDSNDPRFILPREARSFMRSGGLSGQLDSQLKEAADFLNERSTEQFALITKFVGVFVLLLVGTAVLLLAMQVYLKGGAV
jgi:type IV pilus assembly protein PilC